MRYFVTLLIGLGLIVLVLILLIKAIFGGGGGNQPAPKTALITYANTNVVMRMTIDGPVNADQNHRKIQIDVGQTQNEVRFMTGYQGNTIKTQDYSNNSTAYANFLRAIDLQGYTKGDTSRALADERGVCPLGNRYIFEIVDGADVKQRFWSTSCGGTKTYKGLTPTTLSLFKFQIPDYDKLTPGFGLQ